MGAALETIAEDLALPNFRVPAPRNSAKQAAGPPARNPTRRFTGDPQDQPPVREFAENPPPPRQFAGIDIEEFAWARQRMRRAVAFWVLTVLVLTGLLAIAGWTLGANFDSLIGR
jgi:serine/threonine-protein kinase